jgi:hypothetical protein
MDIIFYTSQAFEKKVLRKIFGPKKDKVCGQVAKLGYYITWNSVTLQVT